MRQPIRGLRFVVGALLGLGTVGIGCGSAGGITSVYNGLDGGLDGNGSRLDSTLKGDTEKLGGDGGGCQHSSCAELDANCGAVTDPKCGGIIQCGSSCPTGQACGGGGVPNRCGNGGGDSGNDSCARLTCASQGIACGPAGDGCGGTLHCGSCTAPQACGGDPSKPGQCGCTGICAQIPTCSGDGGAGTTTTLSGKVYDPAGNLPLYHVLVYIPNNPSDPGLQPFPAGITCDVCGAEAAGDPLVTTYTGTDGTFTLTGVPVGTSIPLVIQIGRWRRQFTFPISNSCAPNSIPDQTLLMPSTHMQGDMPRVAVLTGSFDPVECMLLKIGINQSEFTVPGGPGYIQFYTANDPSAPAGAQEGAGAVIGTTTPTQDALFATSGGPGGTPEINNYDMTILECEGYPETQSGTEQQALAAYAGAGGRVFSSDYTYTWMYQNPLLMGAAAWDVNQDGNGSAEVGIIDQPPANPTGSAFQTWLTPVFASAQNDYVLLNPVFHNTSAIVSPTQPWLHSQEEGGAVTTPIHFTFNTPIGAPSANQCGRITFSDWHAQGNNLRSAGTTFPSACPTCQVGGQTSYECPLTPQEAILEFMLFDLSACVQPYTPVCTPRTCTAANVECGPASDGCGNLLQCGPCTGGQTCGGGGPGKCGASVACNPESCTSQSIQCGPAGDGCGNEIQCGNCPTGEICGLDGPGLCGAPAK